MAATKKILVTGGAGFIGSFIVDELVAKGHEVAIFDNLDAQVHCGGKKPAHLNRKAKFVLGDVQELDSIKKVLKAEKPEVIYHEAAAVGVGQSMYEIRRYVSVNDIGAANLLQAVLESNLPIKKLIVASSMSIYGEGRYLCGKCGPVNPPLRKSEQLESKKWEMTCPTCGSIVAPVPTDEEKPLKPTSIYAVTKRTQEEVFLSYGRAYGIPTVAFRYFNVYGPRQALSNPYTGVVAIFSSRIKNGNPPVVFEDGFQSRDFVSVHDIARANVMALDRGEGCYNVGSGKPVSILEIANTLIRLYGGKKQKPEVRNQFRKGDIRHCFADISRIKKELGWSPETKFDDGMRELIGWAGHEEAKDGFEKAEKEMKKWGL